MSMWSCCVKLYRRGYCKFLIYGRGKQTWDAYLFIIAPILSLYTAVLERWLWRREDLKKCWSLLTNNWAPSCMKEIPPLVLPPCPHRPPPWRIKLITNFLLNHFKNKRQVYDSSPTLSHTLVNHLSYVQKLLFISGIICNGLFLEGHSGDWSRSQLSLDGRRGTPWTGRQSGA